MKNLYKQKREQGFTIIEVLIVLSIAALILLIVFLAVPALQRNSRNTQVRNDAGVLLGYTNDYTSNHNGALPTTAFYDTATGNVCMDSTGSVTTCANGAANYVGKLRAGLTVNFNISATAPATFPSTPSTLQVWYGGKCNANAFGSASSRAASLGYVTETGGGTSAQCQES